MADDGPRCYALIINATGGAGSPDATGGSSKASPFYCSKITSVKAYMAMNREVCFSSVDLCVCVLRCRHGDAGDIMIYTYTK